MRLRPEWTSLRAAARGKGDSARRAALAVIDRFGFLQLDTVSIVGARSHSIVELSRLCGVSPALGEELLVADAPLFEYWGHEASWLPIELHPRFEFRRRAFRTHPWWGDIINENNPLACRLMKRIRDEGPLRSVEMEGPGGRGWWDFKSAKRTYAYYCLPVLADEMLIGRVDLKADRKAHTLRVLSRHFEAKRPSAVYRTAMENAWTCFADGLSLDG